jgi:predicted dehydrogenase
MNILRTAIIGCGKIAKRHVETLSAREDVRLVGFCDRILDNAIDFDKTYGPGKVFTDHVNMFQELDLELVYICLPPYAHTNEVELACQYGVHFLIEKPIALSVDKALQMAEYVNASGVKSQVGFMYRHGEAANWLKNLMSNAEPTSKGFMSARYSCNSLHRWWWRDKTRSGGQLVEQVIHILDMTRFFFGEPSRVFSVQDNLFHQAVDDYTVEDVSVTTIQFESGSIAVISATNGAIPNRWDYDWRIVLPTITADFIDANQAVVYNTGQAWPSKIHLTSEKDLFLAQTEDLLSAIRDDRPTAVPIEEGVRSLNLALSAALSAERSFPIDINDL